MTQSFASGLSFGLGMLTAVAAVTIAGLGVTAAACWTIDKLRDFGLLGAKPAAPAPPEPPNAAVVLPFAILRRSAEDRA